MRTLLLLVCLLLFVPMAAQASPIVLKPSGQVRDGYPVMVEHPRAEVVAAVLDQGFAGVLTRLYTLEQTYISRKGGPEPQPAYLVLKTGSGGFPKNGFYLGDQAKQNVAYAEVNDGVITGQFGAVDQIFPHELAHVILEQLTGPMGGMKAAQIHAIGVQTDAELAFNEGFAEHMQIMAIDDPDAAPDTKALTADRDGYQAIQNRLNAYRDELAGPRSALARAEFRGWYASAEQALRYFAVKENGFARQPTIPARLLLRPNLYGAYLLSNTEPGDKNGPPKSAAQMLATEGVVSALFDRWVNDPALQSHYRDDPFYQQFGVDARAVGPLENAYLKLFDALYRKKPHTAAGLINGYKELFPDEAPLVEQVTGEILLGQPVPDQPELWLSNRGFPIGLTIFDQFRHQAHANAFDLNAASMVDLLAIPGVDRPLAEALLKGAPYTSMADLDRVAGLPESLKRRLGVMADRYERYGAKGQELLISLLVDAGARLLLLTLPGALLYWVIRRSRWWRAGLNALAIGSLTLLPAWYLSGWLDLTLPLVAALLFGIPAALWRLRPKVRDGRGALRVLLAWCAAALPALVYSFIRF